MADDEISGRDSGGMSWEDGVVLIGSILAKPPHRPGNWISGRGAGR